MERQTITVDIAPGNSQVERLGSSQGDIGRPMGVYIIQNGVALDCSAYSAELYIIKPDGKFYTTQATVDATEKNLIKWETALQETPVAGACAAQIRIAAGDDDIGTARFVEFVEASPGDMGSASESEVALLTEYVRQARESATSAGRDATTASGAASSASGSASTASAAASTATQAASTATAAAERAEEIEESIPEDYSQLSDDVTGLKSALINTAFLSGNGNTYVEQDFAVVKAGGSYKVRICSWDTSAVTITGGFTKFYLGYKNNGTKVRIAEVMIAGTIESEYSVQIPSDVIDPVLVIGGRVTASKQGVVNIVDVSLDAEIVVIKQDLTQVQLDIGNYLSDLFELGNIAISNSGFVYTEATSRVRTKEGTMFHLKAGVTVGLKNYTGFMYYVGWKKSDGAYGYYDGWRQEDFITPIEADYVFILRYYTEATITDVDALSNNFFGYSLSDVVKQDVIKRFETYEDIPFMVNNGFIGASGSISPQSSSKEVYTSLIPCNVGDSFNISVKYTSQHILWIAYGIFDEFGDFIERIVVESYLSGLGNTYDITISNEMAKFLSFSYRTYDDATVTIKSQRLLGIPLTAISLLRKHQFFQHATINTNVKSVNHRGYNTVAPENTLPAYKLSREMGFDRAETDVAFTSDGVAVLLHDETINRTARNEDGSEIDSTIRIADITYDQALNYDFGIWKSAEYVGTKIPKFEEFVSLCKKIGIHPYVELKLGLTSVQVQELVEIVKSHAMTENVTWISFSSELLGYIKNSLPDSRLGLVVSTVDSSLISIAKGLQTANNKVFIDTQIGNANEVSLCKAEDIPLEIWNVQTANALKNVDSYISGATTDSLHFGYELFKAEIS